MPDVFLNKINKNETSEILIKNTITNSIELYHIKNKPMTIVMDANSSHLSKKTIGAVLEIELPVFFFNNTDFNNEPAAPGVINIDKLDI